MDEYSPDDILELTAPTTEFLCPVIANKYGIEFLAFNIKDYTTKKLLFEVSKKGVMESMRRAAQSGKQLKKPNDPDAYRSIVYDFSATVLKSEIITTDLTFKVGDQPLENFRMIERHYFKDRLIQSFDFDFGFCIPETVNTWQSSYDVPPINSDLLEEIVANPYETISDSFYFVNEKLVIHNKASYRYFYPETESESKVGEDEYPSDVDSEEGKSTTSDDNNNNNNDINDGEFKDDESDMTEDGEPFHLPMDAYGEITIVVNSFKIWGQRQGSRWRDDWDEAVKENPAALKDVKMIEISTYEGFLYHALQPIFRFFIKLKESKSNHSRIATVVSKLNWMDLNKIQGLNRFICYVHLLDRESKMRWFACGEPTPRDMKSLIKYASQLSTLSKVKSAQGQITPLGHKGRGGRQPKLKLQNKNNDKL